jgi:protein ImuB
MSRRVVDRLACVNVAALPLQLLLQVQPGWIDLPVAVVEDDRPQAVVLFHNARAYRAGVRSGQRYATALALSKDLRAAVVPRSQIDQHVRFLAECLRRYSPHVEPSADTPGIFWLDAKGLTRLYPSLHAWAQAVRLELQRAGMRGTVAVGVSRFGAYALAKFYQGTAICAEAGEERAAVRRVPLSCLDLDPDVRERLLTLGIETVGDFLRLPGDAVRHRFGEAADTLYRLASGQRWAPLVPVPADEPQERQLHFDVPETNTERLVFVVKRLLDSLIAAIARQAHAVVALTLWMKLDDRSTQVERVRPAASTLDAAQLLTLVRLRLDALRLPAGIVTLRVRADTCGATPAQRRLLQQARRDPDAANQALARLRAECGDDSVVRARVCDAHLPTARYAWERLDEVPAQATPRVVTLRPLVRRIFTKPIALPGTRSGGPVRAQTLAGPYVMSGGWWGGVGVHRDYYFARTDEGNLWWMYDDRRKDRVFLQGHVE